jgi:hypothetical protein
MPNPIKYTTGTETLALKKGNFYIGTGDVGKGPSDTTGYYQGISPSEGGYVIYMNREGAPGDLSYHNAPTDSELITFTNNLAGQSYTTVNECLVYFAGQSDKVVLNRDYEGIVTDGLILNVDAGFTPSYPKNGTTWYNLNGSINGSLTNGPTFSSDNGGSIVFDGTNDQVTFSSFSSNPSQITCDTWFKVDTSNITGSLVAGWIMGIEGQFRIIYDTTGLFWVCRPSNSVWYGTGTSVNYSYGSSISDIWFNVTGTYNGSYNSIYINGTLQSTGATISGTVNLTNNFVIGRGVSPNVAFQKGNGAVYRIYNRALSDSEILQNFNAQKGRFGL